MGILKQKIEASRNYKLLVHNNNGNNESISSSPSPDNQAKDTTDTSGSGSGSDPNTRNGISTKPIKNSTKSKQSKETKRRQRLQGDSITPKIYLEAKNIVTNFGKAIATFATSEIAVPYLSYALANHTNNGGPGRVNRQDGPLDQDVSLEDFLDFVKNHKTNINSIEGFRRLLLVQEEDSDKEAILKGVFKEIAEVFIKYFSVNWIIHGRVTYKLEHLKFRNKMLRRIQNPEMFTYLKGHKEKRRKSRKEVTA